MKKLVLAVLLMISALMLSCQQSQSQSAEPTTQSVEATPQDSQVPTAKVTWIKNNCSEGPSLYLVEFEGKRFLVQYHGGIVELKN